MVARLNIRADTDDYRRLLTDALPLLDVRAPIEFAAGALPRAVNIPLLDNDERAQVGTTYKQQGQQAAIALGEALVCGETKAARLAAWRQFAQAHPTGYLYCFRGGLRSQTVQQWLRAAGIDYPLISGGYKAMRQFLLAELERLSVCTSLAIVGGRTGSGKTRVIQALAHAIDLEAMAQHRGSSFGQLPGGQPSQIDFENTLSTALLRAENSGKGTLWLEDESQMIGRCALPLSLRANMTQAPLALIEEPLAARVQVVLEEYVINALPLYAPTGDDQGFTLFAANLLHSLDRVKKRLGGLMHGKAQALMNQALAMQQSSGAVELHRDWIALLLTHYYDPMYDWQLTQKQGEILFRGRRNEVIDWIKTRNT